MATRLWKRKLLTGPELIRVRIPVAVPGREYVVQAAEHTPDSLKSPPKNLYPGFSPGQSLWKSQGTHV